MYKDLFKELLETQKKSYSPYSNFRVAAIILLKNGEKYYGANIENAAYGECICAERTALVQFKMDKIDPKEVEYIAIIGDTDKICTPCGSCRQVMAELLLPSTKVIMFDRNGKFVETTVDQIIPGSFTNSSF